mmetsp:Transcript_24144/g.35409  ORF Transcript_24144/g.35409 Transcript_24144/m.35409 type:complete len:216 (+) Transcript_24144:191-838(+)
MVFSGFNMSSSSSRITTNNRDEFHCREESFRKCNWLTWFLVLNLLAGNHLVLAYGSSCEDNEAHIQVDLIVSELSNGSGWSITDNEGLEHMGSCPGCTRLRSRTKHSIAQCISRSKCGGDGGDGRLTFAFEGTGYYESSSVYIDGYLVHFGQGGDRRSVFSLHCPNESLLRQLPQQCWKHGVDAFLDKVHGFISLPYKIPQQLVHEFYRIHQSFT